MQKELKCPKCGGTHIEEDDCFETFRGGNNTFKECFCGHCETCGTDLQWEKVYKFMGYDEIEES